MFGIKDSSNGETQENPEIKLKDIGYCCCFCSSLIEILYINENNDIIEFRCSNKNNIHEREIKIEEYLKRIKNKNFEMNKDKCEEHKDIYQTFCLDCDKHLCNICLEDLSHIEHHKINFIEIQPIQGELETLEKIINYYEESEDNIRREKIRIKMQIKEPSLQYNEKINKIKNKKLKEIEDKKEKELAKNKEKYLKEIETIKKLYEKELKDKKVEYENNQNKIINQYKYSKEKINCLYQKKKERLDKKKEELENKLKSKEKIESLNNIKKINELVYQTYKMFPNNFYNAINVHHLIINYYKNNAYIKNNIIKNIFKNDQKINIILRKTEAFNKMKKEIKKISHKTHSLRDKNKTINTLDLKSNRGNYQLNISVSNASEKNNKSYNIYKTEPNQNSFDENVDEYNKKNENLFNFFNNLFFWNKEQTSIKDIRINENQQELLRKKYVNYKKENKERILINYFDNFIKVTVLGCFKRDNERKYIKDILKYNIEVILNCFEMHRNTYACYYYPTYSKNNEIKDRKKSTEAAKKFRREFNIESEIIKDEELIKKLDKNDNDINKVFQQLYG